MGRDRYRDGEIVRESIRETERERERERERDISLLSSTGPELPTCPVVVPTAQFLIHLLTNETHH